MVSGTFRDFSGGLDNTRSNNTRTLVIETSGGGVSDSGTVFRTRARTVTVTRTNAGARTRTVTVIRTTISWSDSTFTRSSDGFGGHLITGSNNSCSDDTRSDLIGTLVISRTRSDSVSDSLTNSMGVNDSDGGTSARTVITWNSDGFSCNGVVR
ncbi:unnamed protein product [Ambrosiozyma monospora]|uniref:Unnamed protein product n=1 Tax=Ambrosiozyma monospora TaxID=43982 RepID=A0ACB5U7N4_AMBMO|nr:unnamed protein product [Ambrosiozyma monospora]